MSWFVQSFGARYRQLYAHRDEAEAARALALLEPAAGWPGRWVLDLACGSGRYSRRLRTLGAEVFGADLSTVLLMEAKWADPAGHYLRADMREVPLADRSVDDCLSMFTSFGYFDTVSEHVELAAEMARVSRERVIIDIPNPAALESNLVPQSERELQEFLVRETRWNEETPRRVRKRTELVAADGVVMEEYEESVMLFELEQLVEFFEPQGFSLARCHGAYSGEEFRRASSGRQICLFERSPA